MDETQFTERREQGRDDQERRPPRMLSFPKPFEPLPQANVPRPRRWRSLRELLRGRGR